MSFSSENQRIIARISEIDTEIKARENSIKDEENRRNEHILEQAMKDVDFFVEKVLTESFLKEYTLDELLTMYRGVRSELDEDERNVLTKEYPNILQKIQEKLRARRDSKGLVGLQLCVLCQSKKILGMRGLLMRL